MEAPRDRIRPTSLLFLLLIATCLLHADPQPQPNQVGPAALKGMTLEELSEIEVTTPSKEPQKANRTPMAIYVITGEEIRRSGATCIPEALRLAPGVEVARIDANKWSIGIRGFGSRLSRSVLVLIDWAHRLHHPVRRHVLGSAGHRHGRYRPYRGDPRSGRHHMGTERRQRDYQRAHEELAGYAGDSGIGRRRQ